jgi:hypothetical protein
MTPAELELVAFLEKRGRKLTPQEAWLAIQQARQIGDLDGEPEGWLPPPCGVTWTWRRRPTSPSC